MITATEKRRAFRKILTGDTCYHPGSVFDPLSARLADEAGFECLMLAGSVASYVVLGAPDVVIMSVSELAEQCHRVCRASTVPLLVDADHGFGNALSVMRTVQELEHAGVAALSIEDTQLPVAFGQGDKPVLTSVEEGVGRMKAALEARGDENLVIAGRTSALMIEGLDGCIARLKAYEAAGVDAMFVIGIKNEEDLKAITSAVKLPLIMAHPGKALADLSLLGKYGARVCLQPHVPIAAAIQAMENTYKALREGTDPGDVPGVADNALIKKATGQATYDDWASRFLK